MQLKVRLPAKIAIALLGSASLALAGGAAGASAAPGPGARPHPAVGRMLRPPHPLNRAIRGTTQLQSFNWSGYAQSGANGTYKAVEDTWTVPTVNTTLKGSQFSSDWVGIGGFNDATLVQAGTEADNIGGTAHYDAWTEILPAAEVVIPGLTIKPGNKILTTVVETKAGTWKMTVKDLTTGKSGGKTVSYSSSGASVEAIHERPCIADGCTSTSDLAALTKTNNVSFDPGELSTAAPGTPAFKPLLKTVTGATLNEIFMINNAATTVIAAPSNHDSDNDGFRVAYGSKSPPAPAS
jgi:hypothetical protein